MKGKAIGVGTGPGDPELMTLKAVKVIRENDVIAVPGNDVKDTLAYRIAVGAVPELISKELLPLYMPMVMDLEEQHRNHVQAAHTIETYLDKGKNVVFLTLGDPSVYSTFTYLQKILEEDGYETEIIPGITSFCAAAARANVPLCEWNEQLHIIPALHKTEDGLSLSGNYVLMKSGSRMEEVKALLRASGRDVSMVENCGLDNEKVYSGTEEIPDNAGYFSLIIAKEHK